MVCDGLSYYLGRIIQNAFDGGRPHGRVANGMAGEGGDEVPRFAEQTTWESASESHR